VAVDLDGLTLDVEDEGSGEVVVLVHGSASDRRTWETTFRLLSWHFRTISYSRRYHWPNPPIGDDGYTMSEQVDDLAAVIESLDVERVHLIGHSYGGFIALLLSIRRPELVRSQILIEPPVVPLVASDRSKLTGLAKLLITKPRLGLGLVKLGLGGVVPAAKAARAGDLDEAARRLGRAGLGREAFSQLSEARWQQVRSNNTAAGWHRQNFDPVTEDQVRSVVAPTLLVSGSRSPGVWPHLASHLDSLLRLSSHEIIPSASHLVHEDNPGAFIQAAVSFLTPPGDGRPTLKVL